MYKVSRPYALLSGYLDNSDCLRLFVVVIYCYHGDGSAGRHVCIYKVSRPVGHTYYDQQLIGCYVGNGVL